MSSQVHKVSPVLKISSTVLAIFLLGAVPAFGAMDDSILPAPDSQGKWGYVEAATGKTLIAPQFSRADFFYDGVAIVSRTYPEEAYTVKTTDGRTMRRVPEREGIIDKNGREIMPPLYEVKRANTDMGFTWRGAYIPRLFLVEGGEGESLVLHADRGVIVPAGKHEKIRFTAEGGVFCDGTYYTPDGARLSPPSGCEVARLEAETGMFRTRKKGKRPDAPEGLMRPDGTVLIPAKYHEITAVPRAGLWLASRLDASVRATVARAILSGGDPEISDDKDVMTVEVYDGSGRVLRSFRARWTPDVSGENYSYTSRGREYRVNARTGEGEPEKERPADSSGYRVFKDGGLFGIKDAAQTVTVFPEYEELRSLRGGLFAGTKKKEYYNNNYGVIDGRGKEIVPFVYGGISPASYPAPDSGGLLCMKFEDVPQYWLLDRAGRFITPEAAPYTDSAFYFNAAGQAVVYRSGKYGLIDHTGKEILPCELTDVTDDLRMSGGRDKPLPREALYRVRRGDLWGLYDGRGQALINCRYGFIDTPNEPGEGWVRVEAVGDRNKNGLVNFRTGQVIPPQYTSVRVYPGFFLAYIHGNDTPDGREAHAVLNRQGRETARYGRAEWFEGPKVLAARQGKKYAILDGGARALTPFKYVDVSKADGPFVWGRLETGSVLLDGKGREYRISKN